MPLRLFNTSSRTKQEIDVSGEEVTIYACGITPYSPSHIGHARQAIAFDTLVRWLRFQGVRVRYVTNFTDISDTIIDASKKEGVDFLEVANRHISDYRISMNRLNVLDADAYPRVTESIEGIISMIETLVKKGHAYLAGDGVYFEIDTAPEKYGRLTGQTLEMVRSGAGGRVASTGAGKRDHRDFALWKIAKPGEPSWDSPFGRGRPGWHIECSAMSRDYLGKNFDIHGGGLDLKFPHHENENAQSKCNHDGLFANFWLHTGSLTIDEEKMSKSLGNFVTIKDILKRYHPEVIRFFLYSTHYRNPLNFSLNGLDESKKTLDKFYDALRKVDLHDPKDVPLDEGVIESLEDDFNSPKLISFLHKILDKLNKSFLNNKHESKSIANLLISSGSVMGLFQAKPDEYFKFISSEVLITEEEIEDLITKRNLARNQKDFNKSDKIRDDLKVKGITLEDVGEKTIWKRGTLDE